MGYYTNFHEKLFLLLIIIHVRPINANKAFSANMTSVIEEYYLQNIKNRDKLKDKAMLVKTYIL